MGTVANIYDSGPISPIARIHDNIAIWTENKYLPYRIEWMEGVPASSPWVVDLCFPPPAGPFTALPANGQIAKTAIALFQQNKNELVHFRWEPIDDVEGGLWELGTVNRYSPKGGAARVTPFTGDRDPWLATTTFFILGINKDIQLGCYNPQAVAQFVARFSFFGYRYVLSEQLPDSALNGPITFLPAQGMQ